METLNYRYTFFFSSDRHETFEVELDANTLDPVDDEAGKLPEWSRLDFHQCSHCPLEVETHPHCPLAARLVKVVTRFEDILSYEALRVEAETQDRQVSKETTAQHGVSSLMGLIMATSGCPHTAFFKPMARFHLPLATGDETIYRASAMYLLAQYFLQKDGREADLELKGLAKIYGNVQKLNSAMANRIRAAISQDAAVNAIVILDFFALNFSYVIEDQLEDIRYLFAPYFEQADT